MVTKAIVTVEITDENTGEVSVKNFDIAAMVANELVGAKLKSKTTKSKLFEEDTPKLILDENKFILSTGAMNKLNIAPGDSSKLTINYQKIGKLEFPIIGKSGVFGESGGGKLSKTGTVRFGGSKHDILKEFGEEFILVSHPNSNSLFILTQDGSLPEADYTIESFNKSTKEANTVKPAPKKEEVEAPQPEPETESMDDLEALLNGSDDIKVDDFSL